MLLANQFAIQMCRELGLPLFPGFSERATATLLGYRWPGNIRELKNVVERSVYRHGDSEHELDAIILNPFRQTAASEPETVSGDELPALPLDLRDFQLQQEKRLLQRSLQQAKYHPVSYTHLDVYKRQLPDRATRRQDAPPRKKN